MLARYLALLLACGLFVGLLGCNRDPNFRKQNYLARGTRYFDKAQFEEAAIEFANAVKLDPQYAPAHYKLGETFLRMHRFQDAYRELQRTLELDPGNSQASLDLGMMFVAARSYEQAQAIAGRMSKQNPKDGNAHLLLSELNRSQGHLDTAWQEAQQAIAADPSNPRFYVQAASVQLARSQPSAAEISLKRALTLVPNFLPAVQALAEVYERTGAWSDAATQFQKAIELQPKAAEPRNRLARLYYAHGRKAEAEQVMIQAKKDLSGEGDLYRILGSYYNDIGDSDKALAEFAAISREHPDDLPTREDYIRLLLSHGQLPEAERLDSQILAAHPNDTAAQIIRGTVLNSQHRFEDAAITLQTALKNAPEDATGHYQLGIAFSRTGQPERAKQEWLLAAKLAPHRNEIQVALAQLAAGNHDRQLLAASAEQLIRSSPSDPRGYIWRAQTEAAASAKEDLNKAIAVAPESPLAYCAMGDLLRRLGKKVEARAYYEQALERDPNYLEPLAQLAALMIAQRQGAQAVMRVQAQVAKSPRNDGMYALLGGLQVANHDLVGAEASLRKAVQLNPANVDAYVLLSKVEMARGEAERALKTAYQSIQDNPRNATAYCFAGTLEQLQKHTAKAEEDYKKALQLQPNYGPAANNLAYLMLEHRGDANLALSLAQTARNNMPDSSSAADTLAWAYYHKGVFRLAADLLREALRKDPDNPTYQYHLALVYYKQNNNAAAKEHLDRALQIRPNPELAAQIRKTLSQLN